MTIESTKEKPVVARHLPGEVGIWVFILGDMWMFAAFFLTFVFYRQKQMVMYAESQRALSKTFGLTNTLLLLTSSWFVALAVNRMRQRRRQLVIAPLVLAIACGAGFVVMKFFEYRDKIAAGITVLTNEFFMFYFMFTGIHLVHVLIGLGVLLYLVAISRKAELIARDVRAFESGAVFWHLVDLLWVVLFALLYLMR